MKSKNLFFLNVASALLIFVFSSCKKDIPVSDVIVDHNIAVLLPSAQLTLTPTVFPEDATDDSLIWDSTDPEVASVVNGVVTAGTKEGTTDISVTASNGKNAICNVTVTTKQMILTSQNPNPDYVVIGLAGANNVAIDWGDGTINYRSITSSVSNVLHTYSEAGIYNIKITGSHISNLNCPNNRLTNIDVSKNTLLTNLLCSNNQLKSLDVSQNTALISLGCHYNELTSLDVSNNTELLSFACRNNQLTSLNVSGLSKLDFLWCDNNELTSLDVHELTLLRDLDCSYNTLTELDFSNNLLLRTVNCRYNELTADEINKMFESLHNNSQIPQPRTINIRNNIGRLTCDRTIAENKDWVVIY